MSELGQSFYLDCGFETAIERIIQELAVEGFTVISRIDLDKAFPEGLEINSQRFSILGACNSQLAYQAIESGGTVPAVLNAANEVAVKYFLQEKIGFTDIARVIRSTMDASTPSPVPFTRTPPCLASAASVRRSYWRITARASLSPASAMKEVEDSRSVNTTTEKVLVRVRSCISSEIVSSARANSRSCESA